MRQILVLGVGRSSVYLLEYLNAKAASSQWTIVACDRDPALLEEKLSGLENVHGKCLDIGDVGALTLEISAADIVVSMLPPSMHLQIAGICLELNKHLATASYVSAELEALNHSVKEKGLVFLNEMGLDPGIDHMSAMKLIHHINAQGGQIVSFESYCGGLIHEDDCNNNPWKYKFSWNPSNVVLAAQGGMTSFREKSALRYIPSHRVFSEAREVKTKDFGDFDGYANRDSLKYISTYGLDHVETFLRGTLRRKGYCSAWSVLVGLGFTDNTTPIKASVNTPSKLIDCLTGRIANVSFSSWLFDNGWIDAEQRGYFDFLESDLTHLPPCNGTAANMLQNWLQHKWQLNSNDRDQVYLTHKLGFVMNGTLKTMHSEMMLTGHDQSHTAMAKTVGLPLAMGVELILNNPGIPRGIQIPVTEDWYVPILPQLEKQGVVFKEFTES